MNRILFRHLPLAALGLALAGAALAQQGLYEPEPPANSAFFRVVHAAPAAGEVDVVLDGKVKLKAVAYRGASDYFVLPAGKHEVRLTAAGKSEAVLSENVTVAARRFYSLVAWAPGGKLATKLFTDTPNTNKAKAQLVAYHLASGAGAADVLTADGGTTVFKGLAAGDSKSILVNPIKVGAIVTAAGTKSPVLAEVDLSFQAGNSYSVFVFPGTGGKFSATFVPSKTAR